VKKYGFLEVLSAGMIHISFIKYTSSRNNPFIGYLYYLIWPTNSYFSVGDNGQIKMEKISEKMSASERLGTK
jgi:hypothetical protein